MFQTPIPVNNVYNKLTPKIPKNIKDNVKPTFHAVEGLFKIGLAMSRVTSEAVLSPVTSLSLMIESCIIRIFFG
jgi:hypothetical protein